MNTVNRLGLALGFVFFASVVTAGCVVVRDRRGVGHPVAAPGPRCHPSQYWDGYQCRHKGHGHDPDRGRGRGYGRGHDHH